MKYKVIGSNSKGNSVIYDERFMVDCGVPYSHIKNDIKYLEFVFLTHRHNDHFNLKSLTTLNAKGIKIVCCEWLKEPLERLGITPYVVELNKWYDFGSIKASAFKLYHDVENCGWRLNIDNQKVFHATDTGTLEGIKAKGYQVYAIEANYDEEVLNELVEKQLENGEFAHGIRSRETHLSIQQAQQFIKENATENYEVIELHRSNKYGGGR